MSWHERAAYLMGVLTGAFIGNVSPWPLMVILLLAQAAVCAAISLYLDRKEPFAKNVS